MALRKRLHGLLVLIGLPVFIILHNVSLAATKNLQQDSFAYQPIIATKLAMSDSSINGYGVVHASINKNHYGQNVKSPFLNSTGSRLGFRGRKKLNNGFVGFWQIESNVKFLGGESDRQETPLFTNRNSFVALGTHYGVFVAGKHNSPYKNATLAINVLVGTAADIRSIFGSVPGFYTTNQNASSLFTESLPNTLLYKTPEILRTTYSFSISGMQQNDNDRLNIPVISVSAEWRRKNWYLNYAYERHRGIDRYRQNPDSPEISVTRSDAHFISVKTNWASTRFRAGAEYINIDNANEFANWPRIAWLTGISHRIRNETFHLNVATAGIFFVQDSAKYFSVVWSHKMAPKTEIYAAFINVQNDVEGGYGSYVSPNTIGSDPSTYAFGATHQF